MSKFALFSFKSEDFQKFVTFTGNNSQFAVKKAGKSTKCVKYRDDLPQEKPKSRCVSVKYRVCQL